MKATKSILKHLKIARDNLANQNNKCEYICEALGWPDRGTEKHDAIRFLVENYGMDKSGAWFNKDMRDLGCDHDSCTDVEFIKYMKQARINFLDKVILDLESSLC